MLGIGLMLIPYFYASWKLNGSPLAALNVHANYWHNVDVNAVYGYESQPMTWTHFLLKDRSPLSVITRTFRQYILIFLNPVNRYNQIFLGGHYWDLYSLFLFPFYLLGLAVEIFKRRWNSILLFISFLSISPYFADNSLSPRYFFYVAPFFAYWVGTGVNTIWDFFRRRYASEKFIEITT